MTELLYVGFGGFLGAVARYSVSTWVHRAYGGELPLGTLAVNVAGCLAIGVAMALVDRGSFAPDAHLFFSTGLLGALTTFSTFGFETFDLIRRSLYLHAAASVAANLLLGVGAVVLGIAVSKNLFP
ncbi:MAG: fluoride efflux transporter CrcB [Holophagales bacterium]|nr:fluoride efflux transporter CrcB [Holophagales bacterium]